MCANADLDVEVTVALHALATNKLDVFPEGMREKGYPARLNSWQC